jgi:phosphoglycerate dehydrogenase-like enzyme
VKQPLTVVLAEGLHEECATWLREQLPPGSRVVFAGADGEPSLNELLPVAHALVVRTYTKVDAALLARAPLLKVIGRAGAGLENINVQACQSAGVQVVSTPDANTQAVAEYVWGLILHHFRPHSELPRQCSAHTFHSLRQTEIGREVAELTLGIVGMGRIGKRVACIAHAVGMKVLACDLLPESDIRAGLPAVPFAFVRHADVYSGSDVISVHADGRAGNMKMLGAAEFALMRPDAVFINAARGLLVDHDSLAAWLQRNNSAHVYLDVHDPEPPPPDYPLWNLPNATLLPHQASRSHSALLRMSWVVRDVLKVLQHG